MITVGAMYVAFCCLTNPTNPTTIAPLIRLMRLIRPLTLIRLLSRLIRLHVLLCPPTQQYTCYSFRVVSSPLVLVISPSYFDYRFCNCSAGFFGKPPECTLCQLIPEATSCEGIALTYTKNLWPVREEQEEEERGEEGERYIAVPKFLPCSSRANIYPCNPDGNCELWYNVSGYVVVCTWPYVRVCSTPDLYLP